MRSMMYMRGSSIHETGPQRRARAFVGLGILTLTPAMATSSLHAQIASHEVRLKRHAWTAR